MESQTLKLRIKGRVQGVMFRASCATQARQHGVGGYAKNLPNGDVEVLLTGNKANVQKVLLWCRQGPPAARVDDVEVEPAESAPEENFRTL